MNQFNLQGTRRKMTCVSLYQPLAIGICIGLMQFYLCCTFALNRGFDKVFSLPASARPLP